MKYQVKEEALAATVLGLKQQQSLDDIEESLRQVRAISSSQFKAMYKK